MFALFACLSLAVPIVFAVRVVVFVAVVVFIVVVVHDLDRKVLEGADLVHQDLGFTEEFTPSPPAPPTPSCHRLASSPPH